MFEITSRKMQEETDKSSCLRLSTALSERKGRTDLCLHLGGAAEPEIQFWDSSVHMLYLNVGKPPRKSASLENRRQRAGLVQRCAVQEWKAIYRAWRMGRLTEHRGTQAGAGLRPQLTGQMLPRAQMGKWPSDWGTLKTQSRVASKYKRKLNRNGLKIRRLAEIQERVWAPSVYPLIKDGGVGVRSQEEVLFLRNGELIATCWWEWLRRKEPYLGALQPQGQSPQTARMGGAGLGGTMEWLDPVLRSCYTQRSRKTPPHEQTGDLWTTEVQPRVEAGTESYDSNIRFTREDPHPRAGNSHSSVPGRESNRSHQYWGGGGGGRLPEPYKMVPADNPRNSRSSSPT